jgi:hypothetical protein
MITLSLFGGLAVGVIVGLLACGFMLRTVNRKSDEIDRAVLSTLKKMDRHGSDQAR